MTSQFQLSGISWETIVAILGAFAWLPWIFDKMNPSKLYGKIISNFVNQGQFNNKNGTMHFLKLSISCMNKDFIIDEIDIAIKYKNNQKWYAGSIFWARTSTWVMDSAGVSKKELVIPNENYLGFVNMFEKNKSSFYYLTFIVEKDTLEEFETIEISFTDPKQTIEFLKFQAENINPDRVLFDDNIWK